MILHFCMLNQAYIITFKLSGAMDQNPKRKKPKGRWRISSQISTGCPREAFEYHSFKLGNAGLNVSIGPLRAATAPFAGILIHASQIPIEIATDCSSCI